MTPIDARLQQALDGERDAADLPPDLREAYARLTAAAALLSAAPARSVAERVMTEIRRSAAAPSAARGGVAGRLARWLGRPRAVTLRLTTTPAWPLALGVAGATLALVLLVPGRPARPGVEEGIAQFVGHFPGARSVEVVGSFNDWRRGDVALRDDDNNGIWHGAIVLPAGQHEYMFVVDGERWVPDPLAGRYVDDGFGRENALLIVRPALGP
jgi:hypothetical protein